MAKFTRTCNFSFQDSFGDIIEVKSRMIDTRGLIDYQNSVSAVQEKKEGVSDAEHGKAIIELMVNFAVSVITDIKGIEDDEGAIDWTSLSDAQKEEVLLLLPVDFVSEIVSNYFDNINKLKEAHSKK